MNKVGGKKLKLSYACGGSDKPLIGMAIGDYLDKTAAEHPENEALVSVHQGLRYTYAGFNRVCSQTAKGLMALGIKRDDHVAIWSTNRAEWTITQFATARIGAVLVTINPAYRTHELEYALKQSESGTLLLIDSFKSSDYVSMFYQVCPEAKEAAPGELKSEKLPDLKNVIFIGKERRPGMFTWDEVLEMGDSIPDEELAERQASLNFDDPINIQYTSGTTGFPKGVVLTHHNILNNGYFIGENIRITEKDRLCIPVPFYHCFGMVVSNLACITHGSTMVIPAEYFDPLSTLTAVEKERCTALHGVPTMFAAEIGHPDFPKFDLSSLRTGIMAGAPCPIELMKKVNDLMHMGEVCIACGQTELSPVDTITRPDDSMEHRTETVGRPMPHVEVKIIDPETGKIVPVGVQGEICARGYLVMKEYYKNPEATAKQIDANGWNHTEDLGTLDEDGYCKITGRIKDMVIRGGENVYPREIEEFLYTNSKISECQVIGVPDVKYGEELCAWVRLRDGESAAEDEIKEFCRGKIAHYKIPRYIKFTDEFPMTVTGKIRKVEMRETSIKELGLEEAARTKTA